MPAKEQFNSEKDFFELSSVNFTLSYLLLLSLRRLCVSSDLVKKYRIIFFLACERAEFSKSCNLIGSGSGRKFSILPAHGAIPPG